MTKFKLKQLKGVIILTLILAIIFYFTGTNFQDQQSIAIAGIQESSDPNHPVEIYYGQPQFENLEAMLKDLAVKVYPEDRIQTLPLPEMGIGSQITITHATKVNVLDAKLTKLYRTWEETVESFLKEKNIELLGEDSVDTGLSSKIINNMLIKITRVEEVEIKEKEPIDYKVITKNDIDLEKGLTRIDQRGVNGEKEITYKVKRIDGEEVSREKINTKVVKVPTNKIVIIGIGPKYTKYGPYKDTINAAAREYLINGTALHCLMMRESGGSADAGYPDGMYKGLFQYSEGFWQSASSQAGFGGASIYNAQAQIYTTAWALTHGQGRRWPPWPGCSDK